MEITINPSTEMTGRLRHEAKRRGIGVERMVMRLLVEALPYAEDATDQETDAQVEAEVNRLRSMVGWWGVKL
jgi:hypothetical protein